MSLESKRLLPCDVSDESLDRMMKKLAEEKLFERFKPLYTRAYVSAIMAQTKNGKQRTFEYSHEKIIASMQRLDELDLPTFLANVPEKLLKEPIMYAAGRDLKGRRVMIIDWRRVDVKRLDIEAVNKLAMVCFLGYSANEESPHSLYITYAQNLKLGPSDMPKAYKLIRAISKSSMVCFPDGSAGTHHFVPKMLVPIVEFGKRFVPKRAVFKQRVGSYKWLKSELRASCDNLDDILPEDLGGNSVHIEQNLEIKLLSNGWFETRVLDTENSCREIVIIDQRRA